jgi:hypothetical protein
MLFLIGSGGRLWKKVVRNNYFIVKARIAIPGFSFAFLLFIAGFVASPSNKQKDIQPEIIGYIKRRPALK